MKNLRTYKILFFLLIVVISGCSTKKNTWMSRSYQATNTRYNVYFNGYVSYNEGLKNILKANKEDYSSIIPMYPISRHSNASAGTTNMDLTIEKCRKAIKLHSIKVKPVKNYKKANSPDYKLFYNQEEFNPALKEAWLLLAKAEFHKADFLGSVGTFSYIVRHYGADKDMEATCQLWIARAYGEMGWIYEAEQILSKIVQDNLKRSNVGLFASVNADLLLKKHLYKDAIPFLELALSKETDKSLQQRFGFLLAELYQKTKDNKTAYDIYSRVIKSNPPYEMEFNARINRAQLDQGKISGIRKELLKMLKNKNNREYKDQLYYALGNTYLHHGDTLNAIENYKQAADKSTRKGIDKAVALITLGDLYYTKHNYVQAQPCYDEAGKIITNENEDYARVTRRGEMLSELVTQNDIVILQDSLQRLSAMSESKRLEVINKLIEKLNADEKAAAEKELREKQEAKANAEDNFTNLPPIGGNPGAVADWYFYNIDVLRNGESEFLKKWGKRKLEDNWRRTNKATSLFAEENTAQTAEKDSTDTISKSKAISDKKKPEFYLSQIPVTPAQLAKSTAEIANALFSMGEIYRDKIEDIPMSISTFEEFIRRFKTDERVPDACFYIYLMQTKQGNQSEAGMYRSKLINEYPKSKYVKILSQPDYAEKLESMRSVEDSIYNLTYKAYNENDFKTVYKQVTFIKKNYPLSSLMPKFLFLNALSVGKNETPDLFRNALNDLVSSFPQSDVSAMAKDILALMKQGQEAKPGTSSGSLITRREENTKSEINEIAPKQFSTDRQSKHRILFISDADQQSMNKLLYNIASFNFSRFMIKDFDLVINKIDSTQSALSVTNLESYDEAVWYENSVASDAVLTKLMNDFHVQKVIISEENYALLKTGFNLNEYLAFQSNPPVKKQIPLVADNRASKKAAAMPGTKIKGAKVVPVNQNQVDNIKTEKPVELAVNKANTETLAKSTEKIVQKPIDKTILPTTQEVVAKTRPESTIIQKQEDKAKALAEQPIGKSQEEKTKTVTEPATSPKQDDKASAVVNSKQEDKAKATPSLTTQPKQDNVPLFKGLFGYRANEPHFIAIYILSGKIDFEKVKAAFNAYNSKNYGVMNLNVSLETVDKRQVIIIGSLSDAQVAKSYLIRMVKEKSLFEGLRGANYRNLLGSQKNLNVLIQQNALNQYFEFMQQYYLK
ncbi:MAG: tetratricopeptide repeat protein [Bacteroidota bacterium]|nr:tetratricopeptide repeat protein [Bacteroidota bacterium]